MLARIFFNLNANMQDHDVDDDDDDEEDVGSSGGLGLAAVKTLIEVHQKLETCSRTVINVFPENPINAVFRKLTTTELKK